MKKLIIIFILSSFLTGCGIFGDFDPPEIVSHSPSPESLNVDKNISVAVYFSEPMDEAVTENAFSLSASGAGVNGYFHWSGDGRMLTFLPRYSLRPGTPYSVNLDTAAEDRNGNNLEKALLFKFYTGGECVKPYVLSVFPAYGAEGVSQTTNILIRFSESVDKAALINGVSFSPSFDFQLQMLDSDATALFNPVGLLEYGRTYSVSVNSGVKDKEGNSLLEEYQWFFTVGSDFTKPSLLSLACGSSGSPWSESFINQGVEKDDTLIFTFSEEINQSSAENNITFTPSVEGNFQRQDATHLIFSPSGMFDLLAVYNIQLSTSIRDINGNSLDRNYSFNFRINGTNSVPCEVTNIRDTVIPDWQNNQYITIEPGGTYTNIRISFNSPMNQVKVLDHLAVEYMAGSGTMGVKIIRYTWNSPADDVLRIDLAGLDSGNTYRIKITGGKDGARDKNNNYFLEDFVLFFKT